MAHKYNIDYIIKIDENDFKIEFIHKKAGSAEHVIEIDVSSIITIDDNAITKKSYNNFKIVQYKKEGSFIYFVKEPTKDSNNYIVICFNDTNFYDQMKNKIGDDKISPIKKIEDDKISPLNQNTTNVSLITDLKKDYLEPYFKFLLRQSVNKPFKIKKRRT